MIDTKKARDAERPEGEDAGHSDADDAGVSRRMMSDDENEDESDDGGKEWNPTCRYFPLWYLALHGIHKTADK